jgi:hypothetical protein
MSDIHIDSDMVAVRYTARNPYCAQRVASIVSAFKGTKYNPRRDKARGFLDWCSDVADVLVLDPDLCQVFESRCTPPDSSSIVLALISSNANLTIDSAVKLAEAATAQYEEISKELFLILMQLIDLKGAYQEDDQLYIRCPLNGGL